MADQAIAITAGSGTSVDTRTEASNGNHRQVIVIGDPSINNNVATVATQDLGGSDQTTPGVVMRLAGSASVQVVGSTGTLGVHIQSTNGTMGVRFSDEPIVTAYGKEGTTGRAFRMNSDGAIKIYDLAAGTVSISNSPTIASITSSVAVYFDRGNPSVTIAGVNTASTLGVHLTGTTGTLIVKPDPAGTYFVNAAHTAGIFTVTGSTSGGLTSGVTLVAPSASYNYKVFAYSIQTTGIVSSAWRFTNGAGSETELWRPLVTAASTSSSPVGANLAVTPPGFIFATGTNTTLALKTDNASLVHYSVSYIKESA